MTIVEIAKLPTRIAVKRPNHSSSFMFPDKRGWLTCSNGRPAVLTQEDLAADDWEIVCSHKVVQPVPYRSFDDQTLYRYFCQECSQQMVPTGFVRMPQVPDRPDLTADESKPEYKGKEF